MILHLLDAAANIVGSLTLLAGLAWLCVGASRSGPHPQ